MDIIDRYFWFISGAVALLNVLIWRSRLKRLVERGRVSQAEADAFVRGSAVVIGAASVALGVVALIVPASPRCLRPFDFSDAGSAATSAIILMLWVALLAWVWRGGGATFLGRASSVFMNTAVVDTEYSPTVVRLFVTGLVALSGFGAFVVSQGMPTAVGCAGAG